VSKLSDPATTINALIQCDAITQALHEEHKTLYESLRTLSDAIATGASRETITYILDRVQDFCISHFEHEEQFFSERAYSKADAHKTAHKQLIQRLRTVRMAIISDQFAASDIPGLIDSFNSHIVAFDKPAYVWYLWQHFQAEDETPQQLKELCSLDRLGQLSW
jgi:hemerythrin-like metal-binding protein